MGRGRVWATKVSYTYIIVVVIRVFEMVRGIVYEGFYETIIQYNSNDKSNF